MCCSSLYSIWTYEVIMNDAKFHSISYMLPSMFSNTCFLAHTRAFSFSGIRLYCSYFTVVMSESTLTDMKVLKLYMSMYKFTYRMFRKENYCNIGYGYTTLTFLIRVCTVYFKAPEQNSPGSLTSNASIISAIFRQMGCLDFLPAGCALGGGAWNVSRFEAGVGGADDVVAPPLDGAVVDVPFVWDGWWCLALSSRKTCCSKVISASSSSAALLAISRRFRRFRAFLDSLEGPASVRTHKPKCN